MISHCATVMLSDIVANRRDTALKLGADAALDPMAATLEDQVRQLAGDGFYVVFEASGAAPALRQAFSLVRPGGAIVQIGTLGTDDIPLPANQVMAREIQFIGSFRYGNVFGEAIRLVAAGRANLAPLISQVFPYWCQTGVARACAFVALGNCRRQGSCVWVFGGSNPATQKGTKIDAKW